MVSRISCSIAFPGIKMRVTICNSLGSPWRYEWQGIEPVKACAYVYIFVLCMFLICIMWFVSDRWVKSDVNFAWYTGLWFISSVCSGLNLHLCILWNERTLFLSHYQAQWAVCQNWRFYSSTLPSFTYCGNFLLCFGTFLMCFGRCYPVSLDN